MTSPPIRQVELLERANARLHATLARSPEQFPRWVIAVLVVEVLLLCGGSLLAALVGASVGRAVAGAQDLPLGGPSDGVPPYCQHRGRSPAGEPAGEGTMR
jgi:hypothetical protein